jgi:hypothetical protein
MASGMAKAVRARGLPAGIILKTLNNDAVIWLSRPFSEKSARMSTRRIA